MSLLPRFSIAFAVLALVVSAAFASAVGAAVPAGPRLSYAEIEFVPPKHPRSKEEEGPGRSRLVTTDAKGRGARTLAIPSGLEVDPYDVSWDADGSEFAFVADPAKGGGKSRVYVGHDGAGVHAATASGAVGPAMLSPDGSMVAFTRVRERRPKVHGEDPSEILEALTHSSFSESTWIVPTAGGKPRQLTAWGNGYTAMPSSFSPDGSLLAVSVEAPEGRPEVETIDLASGAHRTLETEAAEAVYSPDGSRIAFSSYRGRDSVPGFDGPVGTTDIYVAAADGTGAHAVTHTPKRQESAPSWDPSGERLAFLSAPGGEGGIFERQLGVANADGTCASLLPAPPVRRKLGTVIIGAPAWVPGAGRGAGPISC
jgi:Tol biopolymer transport system component